MAAYAAMTGEGGRPPIFRHAACQKISKAGKAQPFNNIVMAAQAAIHGN